MTQPDAPAGRDGGATAASGASAAPAAPAARLGRKRDHTRDPEILDAALDVLAESGFDGMTIDMVAARAKAGKATIYRRWPSKADLVIDAVACMKAGELDVDRLPDTGTLRGDLVAMIRPRTIEEGERKLRIMAGLFGMLSSSPDLAEAARAAIIEPRAAVNRIFLRRAIDRGEISPACDVEALAVLTPAMATYRLLILRKPVDAEFLLSLIDGVLLPAALAGSQRPRG
jgi:AcrR family transcriptional regulator